MIMCNQQFFFNKRWLSHFINFRSSRAVSLMISWVELSRFITSDLFRFRFGQALALSLGFALKIRFDTRAPNSGRSASPVKNGIESLCGWMRFRCSRCHFCVIYPAQNWPGVLRIASYFYFLSLKTTSSCTRLNSSAKTYTTSFRPKLIFIINDFWHS